MQHDSVNARQVGCPHEGACAGGSRPVRPHAPAGLSVHLSLRTPAVRWVVAAMVTLAGQCTLVARMEPPPAPAPTAAPAAAAGLVARA